MSHFKNVFFSIFCSLLQVPRPDSSHRRDCSGEGAPLPRGQEAEGGGRLAPPPGVREVVPQRIPAVKRARTTRGQCRGNTMMLVAMNSGGTSGIEYGRVNILYYPNKQKTTVGIEKM